MDKECEQVIECCGCGSKWLIDFADVVKIDAVLVQCPLCERRDEVQHGSEGN